MATDKSLKRIYDLRVLGGDAVIKSLKGINDALAENAKLKALANKQILSSQEIAEIEKYKARIKELTVEEYKLKAVQKEAKNEKIALAAESATAANAAKKEKEAQVALEGSYRATVNQMKILRPLIQNANSGSVINYNGQNISFAEAINEYKKLSAAEQEFRRQFQKDGTLVGEYTTGIIQAFKSSGLDNLIRAQIDKTKGQINSLDSSFEMLKKELNEVKNTGKGSFDAIEKEMIDNRNEAMRLRGSLESVEQQFNGFKGIGGQISGSIRESFKSIRTDILRAGLAYLTFQGALQAGKSVFDSTKSLDSLNQALKQVSGTEEELAKNNRFLQETTEQLGLEYIATGVAFKNFYAASTLAGISADETRKIFYSAATSATALKLSQEDTNGVMLAFSQIASKGKVQAEELRGQIGERVPGAFSIAARAIGVTQAELNKMLEKGEVVSSTFLPKFAAELEKTFGGTGTKKVVGLQASVNRLSNEFTALISNNQSGLSKFFTLLIDGAGLLIKTIPILVVALIAYSAAMVRTWVVTSLANEASTLYYVRSVLVRGITIANTIAQTAYSAAMSLFAGTAGRAAAATTLLGTSMRLLPLGLLLTVVAVLVASFKAFGGAVVYGSEGMRKLALQSKIYTEIQQKSNEATAEQISRLNTLAAVVTSTKTSYDTKRVALEELIKTNTRFSAALKDNVIDLEEVKKALADVRAEIILNANAQASAELSAKQYKNYLEVVQVRQQIENAMVTNGGRVDISSFTNTQRSIALNVPNEEEIRSITGDITIGGIRYNSKKYLEALKTIEEKARMNYEAYQSTSAEYEQKLIEDRKRREEENKKAAAVFEVDLPGMKAELDDLNKKINEFKGAQAALDKLISLRDSLQKKYDDALGKKSGNTNNYRGSRLSGEQKDAFKDIDAARDELLAQLKLDYTNSLISEEKYYNDSARININAANKKLAILKTTSAEERKQIAELKLYKIEQEQDLNNKLYALVGNEAERRKALIDQQSQADYKTSISKFNVTEVEKLQAEHLLLQKQLNNQKAFNDKMDFLEKLYHQTSKENAEKRATDLNDIQNKILLNQLNFIIAFQKNEEKLAEDAATKQQNEAKTNTAERSIKVLEDKKLSPEQQANALKRIELEETKLLLAQEVAAANIALQQKEDALRKGLATEVEVSEAKKRLKLAELALLKYTSENEQSTIGKLTNGLKNALGNITGIFKGVKAGQNEIIGAIDKAKEIVKGALASAKENYFNNQRQQVDDELEAANERMDLEQEQLLATAKSESEKESIRRQFADRRKEEEKKAGEERKQIALKQAAIDFGLAVIKTLAAYPFPFSLIPVAALTVAYMIQRAQISQQKFEKGGIVPTKTGGPITGRSHAAGGVKFNYEAEGDELAIINKRSASINKRITATGTPRQILSAINQLGGGVSFASGGHIRKLEYGGLLGSSLRPPQDLSFLNASSEMSQIIGSIALQQRMIKDQSDSINSLNYQLHNIKVQVVAGEVKEKNDEIKKAEAVGTL